MKLCPCLVHSPSMQHRAARLQGRRNRVCGGWGVTVCPSHSDVCSWTVQRPCLSRLLCPQHWVLGWERSSACYLVPYVDSMPRDRLCSAVSSVSSVCPPLSPFFLFSKSSSSHLSLSEFLSFPFLPPSHWQFFYSLSVFFLMFYIGV